MYEGEYMMMSHRFWVTLATAALKNMNPLSIKNQVSTVRGKRNNHTGINISWCWAKDW